jgi:sugar/nucleoside kinase (ribokinase family)
VERAVIATLGDLIGDIVVWASEGFHPGTDTPARIVHTRGGSAANVAGAAAASGAPARFIGCVGDDDLGERLVHDLSAAGVEVRVQRAGRTGSLVAVVGRDGERSFFTDRGASVSLDRFDRTWLDGCRALHVPAYSLDGEPIATTASAAIDAAHAGGLLVTIDCSSTSLIERMGVEAFRHLLERLAPTVVFANRDEARLIDIGSERPAPGTVTTVVRQGGELTWVVSADGTTDVVPVPPVPGVLDTTGAGDAFAAGFLVATLRGASPVDATRQGHRVAALVLTSPGATIEGTT